jgi:hypothetical protein
MSIQDALPMMVKYVNSEDEGEEYIEVPILGVVDSVTGKVEFLNKVIETVRIPKKLVADPIKQPLRRPKHLKTQNQGLQPIHNN